MKIQLSNYNVQEWIVTIAKEMDTEVKIDCDEYLIMVPKQHGQGKIIGYSFKDGLSLFICNCILKDELELVINRGQLHTLSFHFCSEGQFDHILDDGNTEYHLNPLCGSITANKKNCEQVLNFHKGIKILHTNLQVDRKLYLQKVECNLDKVPERLEEVFSDEDCKKHFLYQSNYSLPTAECIQSLVGNKYDGLVKSSFSEAKAMELLSLQLKQYADDTDPDTKNVSIKKYDLERIKKARDLLVQDLQNSPTIKELARMSGINQQKLKTAFKKIYGKTIHQYRRDYALEIAKFLIMEGGLMIGEISCRVGYSNQSHFARRFKEKYGILPKEAQKISENHVLNN